MPPSLPRLFLYLPALTATFQEVNNERFGAASSPELPLIFLSPQREVFILKREGWNAPLYHTREIDEKVSELETVVNEVVKTKPAQNLVYKLTFSELSF